MPIIVEDEAEFFIMNATQALHNKDKVGIGEVAAEMGEEPGTIFVCERDGERIFVTSYGVEEVGPLPHSTTYTEDTGYGYRNHCQHLVILNVFHKGTSPCLLVSGESAAGFNEELPHWVCK